MNEQIVMVENVSLTVKGTRLLDDVSLHAASGEVVGIKGRNGSGKSVLFKCIVGLFVPQRGEITVDGVAVVGERRFPPNVGAIIEKPGFVGSLTAYENLKTLAGLPEIVGIFDPPRMRFPCSERFQRSGSPKRCRHTTS
jgi:ABC-2 type transport system ATP-binding protein